MDQTLVLLTIVGMALVTYIPRVVPLLALASRDLPPVLTRWLSYVPTAVLSAMLVPGVLIQDGAISIEFSNLFLLAAIPSLAVALLTRSFFGTVAVGMALVAGGRYFMAL